MRAVRSRLAFTIAVAALQAGHALAEYPMQPMMYPPVNPAWPGVPANMGYAPAGIYPVAGWGTQRCPCPFPAPPTPPPMPGQQPQAPANMPNPMPAPQPPAPVAPAPAQAPPVDLSAAADQGPAVGSGGYALATPMIGDFLGGFGHVVVPVTGTYAGTGFVGSLPLPVAGTTTATALATIPNLGHGAFKIAENEFARPVDRVFAFYNYYHVKGQFQPGAPTTFDTFGPVTFQSAAKQFEFDLHRETFGFEKAFLGGNASIGVRVPIFQSNGGAPFNATLTTPQPTTAAGGLDATFSGAPLSFDDAQLGDISVVFKYAWVNTADRVNALGLVVTAPSGPGLETVDGKINSTILQPYFGFYRASGGSFFAHGFSSVAIPTDSRDVTIWFNDFGVGYRLGRIVPTAEVHINTPLNHRGLDSSPIGMSDQVILTGGAHLFLTQRAVLTLGAGVPVTGPQPYSVEAAALFNYRF